MSNKNKMTAREMADHIEQIAAENGIVIFYKEGLKARAWRKLRRIRIRPVKTASTYAVALHEIGHVLGRRQSQTRLYAEIGAWEWAKNNAGFWSSVMTSKMRRCLDSYVQWSKRSRRAYAATVEQLKMIEEILK